jgi:hypothetical protein
MSEYQYYEFLAIDRPLTARQVAALRAYSTRATITSTRLPTITSGATSKATRPGGWRSTSMGFSTSRTGERVSSCSASRTAS